ETDIEGQPRDVNGVVDMGADEICEVRNTTQGIWYTNIQDAIDQADDNDVVVAYEWTFYETLDFEGVNLRLTSTDPNNWAVVACTVIDADDDDANVVTFKSGEDGNSVLTGFTLKGGNYGVSCSNSVIPVISDCVIADNNSHGVYCVSASPLITRSKIGKNNDAGVYSSSAAPPMIKSNWIYKNEDGVVLTSATSNALIRNNTIADNNSVGIYVSSGSEPNVSNCILWGNADDMNGCAATYSCIQDTNDANGKGNISEY
ncbi:MAG: right-handed parallel beta-helix repeat-containing protein, partial [Planctomycetota bacterium]